MFIISKTIKGKEFMYSKQHMILCTSKKQAEKLSNFYNEHNNTAVGDFKLKNNELWYVYQIDKYDIRPLYKTKIKKGFIIVVYNN